VITALALLAWRCRYLPVGWFWFFGSLVPMIGIVQVGGQAMADRYAYLPFIGLFCMVVWGIAEVINRKVAAREGAAAVLVLVLIVFGALTYRQIGFWRDSETLWNHTLQVTQNNFVAHDSLAEYQLIQGRFSAGCSHFRSCICSCCLPRSSSAAAMVRRCARASHRPRPAHGLHRRPATQIANSVSRRLHKPDTRA